MPRPPSAKAKAPNDADGHEWRVGAEKDYQEEEMALRRALAAAYKAQKSRERDRDIESNSGSSASCINAGM